MILLNLPKSSSWEMAGDEASFDERSGAQWQQRRPFSFTSSDEGRATYCLRVFEVRVGMATAVWLSLFPVFRDKGL